MSLETAAHLRIAISETIASMRPNPFGGSMPPGTYDLLREHLVRLLEAEAALLLAEVPTPPEPEEAVLAQVHREANAFRALRELMGYVDDGSHTAVVLSQDDATRSYIVRVGSGPSCWGDTLESAIQAKTEKDGLDA